MFNIKTFLSIFGLNQSQESRNQMSNYQAISSKPFKSNSAFAWKIWRSWCCWELILSSSAELTKVVLVIKQPFWLTYKVHMMYWPSWCSLMVAATNKTFIWCSNFKPDLIIWIGWLLVGWLDCFMNMDWSNVQIIGTKLLDGFAVLAI